MPVAPSPRADTSDTEQLRPAAARLPRAANRNENNGSVAPH